MIIEPETVIETIDWWDCSRSPAAFPSSITRPPSPLPHRNPNTLNRFCRLSIAANSFAADCPTQHRHAPSPAANHGRRSPICHAPETGMTIESEISPKNNYRHRAPSPRFAPTHAIHPPPLLPSRQKKTRKTIIGIGRPLPSTGAIRNQVAQGESGIGSMPKPHGKRWEFLKSVQLVVFVLESRSP